MAIKAEITLLRHRELACPTGQSNPLDFWLVDGRHGLVTRNEENPETHVIVGDTHVPPTGMYEPSHVVFCAACPNGCTVSMDDDGTNSVANTIAAFESAKLELLPQGLEVPIRSLLKRI